jgi:hypothetical protein
MALRDLTDAMLRRDGEQLPLLAFSVSIGARASLILDVRGHCIATHRDTTPVLSIEKVEDRD